MPKAELPSQVDVAVAGAGLVGSLLAIGLARRGHKVDIFERRGDMRREAVAVGRSINLAVSTRGLHALREVGLEDLVLKQAIPMRGRMIHPVQGELAFQRYGKDDSECIYSISRAGLNQSLMTAAEETGQVQIHFNQRVTGCDPARKTLRLDGGEVCTKLLFATDGSASAIRHEIAQGTEAFLDYGYKELYIPPKSGGGFLLEKNALHIWPRGTYMLIALPNFDGSFTATLFLPMEGAVSFDKLRTADEVEAFFRERFPDAAPLFQDLTEAFFANPTGRMLTVKCSPWNHGDWALLLGDAAHAIVPFFGQGMNCGFEDCTLLWPILGKPGAFDEFSRARKPDADAIADLAVANFIEMRDKVGDKRFLLEKEVEKILEREFPGDYLSRYRLVTFHRVPYREALAVGAIQDTLLAELCAGLTVARDVNLKRAGELIRERLTQPSTKRYGAPL